MTDAADKTMEVGARIAMLGRTVRRFGAVLWIGLFALLLTLFLVRERGEFSHLWVLLRSARLAWLVAGVAIELVIIGLMAYKNQLLLRRLGHDVGLAPLVEIHLQRQVVGTVVPFGGPASTVAFVRFLTRWGVSTDDAVFTSVLFSVLGTASVAVFIVPVLVWLAVAQQASTLLLIGSAVLLALVAVLAAALWFLMRPIGTPVWLERRTPRRISVFVAQTRAHAVTARDLAPPLAVAVLIDVLGAFIVYTALRAVGVQPSLATAFGGYGVGTVFLLLAPVFQGIGIVELSMSVALERFGVTSAAAVGATLLYRFCELWLPFVLGLGGQSTTRRGARALPPRLPAIATGVTGMATILSVMAPRYHGRFHRFAHYSRLAPDDASRSLTLIAGFLLVVLSYSLLRRKRVAWLAAIGLLGAITVTHILKRHDEVIALVAAVNLALLLIYRHRFRVRSDVPTMRQGLVRFALTVVVALAYGTLGFWLLDRREFGIEFTLWGSLKRTIDLFFSWGDAGLVPRTRYADWFLDSFTVLGAVALAYAVFSLVRPVVWRRTTLPADRERARALVARYGDSSLDFFKTWDDKLFFLVDAPRGQGVIAYGVAMATAIVLGDPVASGAAAFNDVVDEFLDFADANGWRVAFHQCPPAHLDAYRERGLSALKIGEEAVVDVTRFELHGSRRKSLRSTVNRLDRDGYAAVFRAPPQSDDLMADVREVSDAWLQIAGRRERGFTLGEFRDDYIRASPLMTVEDASGRVVAFANVIPDGVEGEATIDLMRRRDDAPNGVMDYLFIRLMEYFRDAGYTRFSLGMAPFAAVGGEAGSPMLERLLGVLSAHLTRFFSYKGLRDYKDKFDPMWEPRYLIYQSEVSLPIVTLALVRLTEER